MIRGCLYTMKKSKQKEEKLYMLHDDRNHPDKGRTPEEIRQGMKEAHEWWEQENRRERLLEECRIK